MKIHRFAVSVVASLVFVLAAGSTSAMVLVDPATRNGSFESGLSGWSTQENPGGVLTAAVIADPTAPDGSNALEIALNDTDSAASSTGQVRQNFSVDLTQGTDFELSAWLKADDATNWNEFVLIMEGLGQGPSGFNVDRDFTIIGRGNDSEPEQWTQYTATWSLDPADFADPVNGVNFSVQIQWQTSTAFDGGNAVAYVDDIVLTQIPEPGSLAVALGASGLLLVRRIRR